MKHVNEVLYRVHMYNVRMYMCVCVCVCVCVCTGTCTYLVAMQPVLIQYNRLLGCRVGV